MPEKKTLDKKLKTLSILFLLNGLISIAMIIPLFTEKNRMFLLFILTVPFLGVSSIVAIIFYLFLLILILIFILDMLLSFILPYIILRKSTCSYKLAMFQSILMVISPPIGLIFGVPSLIIINKYKTLFINKKKD